MGEEVYPLNAYIKLVMSFLSEIGNRYIFRVSRSIVCNVSKAYKSTDVFKHPVENGRRKQINYNADGLITP
jgi:hypothetical protein